MNKGFGAVILLAVLASSSCSSDAEKAAVNAEGKAAVHVEATEKPRLLILTDIGGDPDDQQSLIRLLVYANEFDIEGIIASASGTPGELKEETVKPELIEEIILAYGKVRSNLIQHHTDYSSTEYLLNIIKRGNPHRGLSNIGKGHDTEGSEWIIQVVDQQDSRPVNIAIWGGQTDLAQALWKIKNTRSTEDYNEFISQLRIHDIADQDNIYEWIIDRFPGLFYILNAAPQGEDKRNAVFRGMYLGGNESLTSQEWINTHARENHGPLGALYPSKTWTAPNPHGALKEGDTPSWFYFLPNGLNDPDNPSFGGWGGRFSSGSTYFNDAEDQVGDTTSARATVWRWRPHFQNDFQARMDWCVKSFEEANHNPVAAFRGDAGHDIVHLTASSGDEVQLSAQGSSDPDGDDLSYNWSYYPEPGTYKKEIAITNSHAMNAHFTAPAVDGPETIHIILTVKDNGEPNLYSYRRIIIDVNK